jgi:hypothetical protein
LIGQTEGVLFVDLITETPSENRRITLSDGTNLNRIALFQNPNGTFRFIVIVANVTVVSFFTPSSYPKGTNLKIAFAYKENDFTAYVNGVQMFTDNLGTVPSTSRFNFTEGDSVSYPFIGSVKTAALYKERLTDDQLEALTGEGFNTYAEMASYYNYTLHDRTSKFSIR